MVAGTGKRCKRGRDTGGAGTWTAARPRPNWNALDRSFEQTMSILDKILGYKKEEVAAAKAKADRAELEARARDVDPPRGFARGAGRQERRWANSA